jgi:hypothetical protein
MIGTPVPVDELVMDVDPRNGATTDTLRNVVQTADLPLTQVVVSGRLDGGGHWYMRRLEGDYTNAKTRLPRGLDLKDGGKGALRI